MNARRNLSVRLNVELLEDRRTPTTANIDAAGILRVYGTDAGETIRVTQDNSRVNVEGAGWVSAARVKGVAVYGYGGNDTIDLRTVRVAATVDAGAGNDWVVGGLAGDQLSGGDGYDRLFGMGGNDMLAGGSGNDVLFGMDGTDGLYGQGGNDFLDDGNRARQEYADGGDGSDWNADVVAVNGTTYGDIHQRNSVTCGFLSSLSGLAMRGTDFRRSISYAGFGSDGTPMYDVTFWNGRTWAKTRVGFDGTGAAADPAFSAEGESWTIIMNRAWLQFRNNYNNGRAWPHEAIYALTGKQSQFQYFVADADFNRMTAALNQNRLVMTATHGSPSAALVREHAYTVVQTYSSGSEFWVRLRNPHGYDNDRTTDDNPNDGLIWVRWSDFRASMNYISIT